MLIIKIGRKYQAYHHKLTNIMLNLQMSRHATSVCSVLLCGAVSGCRSGDYFCLWACGVMTSH
jgi:hypothetical protein